MNHKSLEYRNELTQLLLNHYNHLTKKSINQFFITSRNLKEVIDTIYADAAAKRISYNPLPSNIKVNNQELQNDFDTIEDLTPEELEFQQAINFFNLPPDYTDSELEKAFKRTKKNKNQAYKYYQLLKPDAFPDMIGTAEFAKKATINHSRLDKKFIDLLSSTNTYEKLRNFIDDLSIKYYTRKRKDGLIFIHDIHGNSYTIEHDKYGVIKVVSGILVSIEILPFNLNEAGFSYLQLLHNASKNIALGNLYELVMDEKDIFSLSSFRVAELNKIIDLMNYYDDESLVALRKHIEKNLQK